MNYNFSDFYEAFECPVFVFDSFQKITYCNKSTINFFKTEDISSFSKHFKDFLCPVQPDVTRNSLFFENSVKNTTNDNTSNFLWQFKDKNSKDLFCKVTLKKLNLDEDFTICILEDISKTFVDGDKPSYDAHYFRNKLSFANLTSSMFSLFEDAIFFWDLKSSMITFFGKKLSTLTPIGVPLKFPEFFTEHKLIHPDDIEIFNSFAKDAMSGMNSICDVRLLVVANTYKYIRIRYSYVTDENNSPTSFIGIAEDIDVEKQLEIRANTDLLTGCYNKITAENLIAEHLSSNSKTDNVLFIIDIDNFKAVNDNLGHHFGDVVLSDIAAKLKTCFRQDDIIGRIGGDEFLVLAKNLSDILIIKEKANKILEAFINKYHGENADYEISGSVGISRFPFDGTTFKDLYKSSDKALYQSKLKGKNCFTLYTSDLIGGTMENRTILENAGRIADSYFDSDIISEIFDLLFNTNDIKLSIDMALKCIAKKYNADRSYIFETLDNGVMYDNTFEWCKEGITPEILNLQDVPCDVLADFFNDSDSEGVIYSNDLTVLKADGAYELMANQGIKSFVHAQTREKGYVKLFLGLDDCTTPRVWTAKEVNSLKYLAKLLSLFLSYIRK